MQDGHNKNQQWVITQIDIELPKILPLPEPDRSRCLFCLAYEYFNVDMEEEAFKIIAQMDPKYFHDGQMQKDLESIPDFKKLANAVLGKLLTGGYVSTTTTGGSDES